MLLGFEQNFALEDTMLVPKACSLEALACVWPIAFLSGAPLLTGCPL
jgi:hypothetical protein